MSIFSKLFSQDVQRSEWNMLNSTEQIQLIKKASYNMPVLIFKHSTTCGISAMAFDKIEKQTKRLSEKMDLQYLDLLANRVVSNAVASEFGVVHQSPQVILLKDGKVIFNTSHHMINADLILDQLK